MKYCIYIMLLLQFTVTFAQPMTFSEWKDNIGVISEILIREKMLDKDSVTGVWYSNIKTPEQMRALYLKYNAQWIDINKGKTVDFWMGTLNSGVSGIGNGIMISVEYDYPSLGNGSLKKWLTSKASADNTSFYQATEAGKFINDHWSNLAVNRLQRYYGKWYWAYLHNFVVRNLMSSLYRGWAKYDKPFYYWALYLDVGNLIDNLFGE